MRTVEAVAVVGGEGTALVVAGKLQRLIRKRTKVGTLVQHVGDQRPARRHSYRGISNGGKV